MNNRIYPIGIQNFESLRRDNYVYVDKTALIYQLISTGRYYFLSRPRRFGKSLLISTLEAYFEGKRELFEGLAMETLEKDWVKRPVLHFDLNAKKFDTVADLIRLIDRQLLVYESIYGGCPSDVSIDDRFVTLIRRAYEQSGERVAILIDEYDKPLLQSIGNHELQREYRNTLKPFYGVLKSMDGCIKFALLTGVTKFGKVSVFSDLNYLNDLSTDNRYVSLCSMTEKDIHTYFEKELHEIAVKQQITYDEVCRELNNRYGGYHFRENSEGVYNPFSLLNTFKYKEFNNYWFENGTPTSLVKLLKRSNCDLEQMVHTVTSSDVLNSIYDDEEPLPIVFQSGYLTIKDYDKEFKLYYLGFPNKEVEAGFTQLRSLLSHPAF